MLIRFIYSENIIDVIFFLTTLITCSGVYLKYYRKRIEGRLQIWIWGLSITLFSVYGYLDHDFYMYRSLVETFLSNSYKTHMEDIYFVLADLAGNYMAWRWIVWGSAVLIMIWSVMRLKISYQTTYFFITVFFATSFFVMRGSLGTSLLFLGLSYFLSPVKKYQTQSYIFGTGIIIGSYFFHKSMPVALASVAIAYMLPFSKKNIIISLICFPLLVTIVTFGLNSIIVYNPGDTDTQFAMTLNSGADYASGERFEYNLNGLIRQYITYIPIYASLYLLTKEVVFKGYKLPPAIMYLFKYWYVMTYLASLFFFQEVSSWIFIRFICMSYLPMAMVLGYYFKMQKMTPFMWCIMILATISSLFTIIYPLYKRFGFLA